MGATDKTSLSQKTTRVSDSAENARHSDKQRRDAKENPLPQGMLARLNREWVGQRLVKDFNGTPYRGAYKIKYTCLYI